MTEPAIEEDFARLLNAQLKQLCSGRSLSHLGRKRELCHRLAQADPPFSREYIRTLDPHPNCRAVHEPRICSPTECNSAASEFIQRVQSPEATPAAPGSVAAISPSDDELDWLLEIMRRGIIKCERCGRPFLPKNGKFGAFFPCSGQSLGCDQKLTLRKGLLRARSDFPLEPSGSLRLPLRIVFEMRTPSEVRCYLDKAVFASALRVRSAGVACRTGDACEALVQLLADGETVFPLADYAFVVGCVLAFASRLSAPTDPVRVVTLFVNTKDFFLLRAVPFGPTTDCRRLHVQPLELPAVSALDTQPLNQMRDWLRSVGIPVGGTGERRLFEWEINLLIESHSVSLLKLLSDPDCAESSPSELAKMHAATCVLPPAGSHAWLLGEAEVKRLAARAFEQAPSLSRLKSFQVEGLKYVLSRGGRALIADEMGCGKTIQALAAMAAFATWPVIIITPASLRLVWVEEMERWLPQILRPSEIHVIFESNDMLPQSRELPISAKVVITSFTMCRLLTASGNLLRRKWGMAVVDESHHIRYTRGLTAPAAEIQQLLTLLEGIPRVLLCSGTPSLSRWIDIYAQIELLRPGTLGAWQEFYEAYDQHTLASTSHGDFLSPGRCRRPQELRLLLSESVMIRRMKSDVLEELPPKTRHRVRIPVDRAAHGNLIKELSTLKTSYEAAGIFKAHACSEWLRTTIFKRRGGLDDGASDPSVVLFAHHLKVLDQLQLVLHALGVKYSRIDGSTPARERSKLLDGARDGSITVMLIGVTACAQGVDLSWATVAVFVELPPDSGWIQQAEDRLHRRNQHSPVSIFFLLLGYCDGTESDCSEWMTFDLSRWRVLCDRITDLAELHEGCPTKKGGFETMGEQSPFFPQLQLTLKPATARDYSAEFRSIGGCSASLNSSLLRAGDDLFEFEVSKYTDRIYVFCESPVATTTVCGSELPVEQGGEFAPLVAFWAAWQELSPYQRRRFRTQRWSCKSLCEAMTEKPPLATFSTQRLLPRYRSTLWLQPSLRHAEVTAKYTTRTGQRSAIFIQQLSEADVLLCLECSAPLEMSARAPLIKLDRPRRVLNADNAPDVVCSYRTTATEDDLFCTGDCRAAFFLKRNSSTLRRQVGAMDECICQGCGLDCARVIAALKSAPTTEDRIEALDRFPRWKARLSKAQTNYLLRVEPFADGYVWNADHRVAVSEGGGACGLENLQSLCVACHSEKTSIEAKRRFQHKRGLPSSCSDIVPYATLSCSLAVAEELENFDASLEGAIEGMSQDAVRGPPRCSRFWSHPDSEGSCHVQSIAPDVPMGRCKSVPNFVAKRAKVVTVTVETELVHG